METRITPLRDEHIARHALMAPFAGWDMPIHYGSILDEARHTRCAVSIFDITHMGELFVKENPAQSSLERAITVPVTKMKVGRCRYGFLLNEAGGILDDLIVYRLAENEWMIVVNASNEVQDYEMIRDRLSPPAKIENRSAEIVKIDVQGPHSIDVMKAIAGDGVSKLSFYEFGRFDFLGGSHIISRTGYTGELGYEVYVGREKGVELWRKLLSEHDVRPAGLGARDILRLEMGYPLYGHELTADTTPIEAGLDRFLDMNKEFIGKDTLAKQIRDGVAKRLIGFCAESRRIPRHEHLIRIHGVQRGYVTSGVFSPHLNTGIGMGYVDAETAVPGTVIDIVTEKGSFAATIERIPFLNQTSIKHLEA